MDTLSMGKRACIYDDDFRAQILFSCGRPGFLYRARTTLFPFSDIIRAKRMPLCHKKHLYDKREDCLERALQAL